MEGFHQSKRSNCFFLPKFLYKCVGVSVDANDSVKYKFLSTIAIIVAYFYPWGCMHVAFNSNGDFDVFCSAMFKVLGGLTGNGHLSVILINRTRLRKIFENIAKVQENYNIHEWSQKLVHNYNKKVFSAIVFVQTSFFLCFVGTMLQRIIVSDSSKWSMPISDFYLMNITHSPNYEIVWTYHVIAVTVVGATYYGTALLIVSVTVDLTMQFKIFHHDIKQKFNDGVNRLIEGDTEACIESNWLSINSIVKEIVVRHVILIDLVQEVENVFKYMIITHTMGSMCSVCFGLYYSSIVPPSSGTAMQSYFMVLVITVLLFAMCYCGSELSATAQSIDSACYEVNFVGTDLRFQKSLLLIIAQSQQNVKLTVGGFAELSMPVFAWIMKTTYTYLMVLRETSEVINQ